MEWLARKAAQIRVQESAVPSPCISVCRIDCATALCAGCLRTVEEISAWSSLDEVGRRQVWSCIEERALRMSAPRGDLA